MAETKKTVLEVDTSDSVLSIAKLRKEIRELQDAMLNLKEGSDEYNAAAKRIYDNQQQIAKVMTASKGQVAAAEGSFNALNAKLRQLKEEWKATADSNERNRLTGDINKVKAEINTMNESIGNYQHNVGNYTNSIIDAFKQMGVSFGGTSVKFASMAGMLTGGLASIGKAFKALWATMAANPLGVVLAAVGALIGAFSALRNAIRDNEESEERLHRAMAAFRPIADKFHNWLDQVAQGFVNLVEAIADAWNWLRKAYAAYTDWMGITEGRQDKIKAEIAWYDTLAQEENKLNDLTNATKEANAADEEKLNILRDEAAMTDNVAERRKKLVEARKLQEQIGLRNVNLAVEELKILEKQAEKTSNSAEMNNKLSAARQKVLNVNAQNALALRRLDREITGYNKSLAANTKETDKNAEALERQREAMLKAHEDLQRQAEETLKDLQEQLKSERQKEEEDYKKKKELLETFNLSTEELTQIHNDKIAEMDRKEAEASYRRKKEQLEHNAELDQLSNAGGSEGDAFNYDAVVERNNAEFDSFKALNEGKIALNEELMKNYEEGSEEYQRLQNENDKLNAQISAAEAQRNEKNTAAFKMLMKQREQAVKNMVSGTTSILKNLSSAFGESTKLGKGFAIAAATIDTIASAVTGFRAGMNQWADAGPMAWMAPVQAALNATMALTAGFAEVQKIASVDTSGNAQAGSGGGATALAMPNIEGLSSPVDYTRQVTTQTETEEMNRDNRVYILESDIQESNRRVRVREDETTF